MGWLPIFFFCWAYFLQYESVSVSASVTQPSSQPSAVPSRQPSYYETYDPTASPTELPKCPAGSFHMFDIDGFLCLVCPSGSFSGDESSLFCTYYIQQTHYAPIIDVTLMRLPKVHLDHFSSSQTSGSMI